MSRTRKAIERAGRIDRATRFCESSKMEASKLYRELVDDDPETAAIVADIIMRYATVLKTLGDS